MANLQRPLQSGTCGELDLLCFFLFLLGTAGSSVKKYFPLIYSFALAAFTHPLEPLPRKKIKLNENNFALSFGVQVNL